MSNWPVVIEPKLKACESDNQKAKVRIGIRVLDWMIELGRIG
jgi:hypothetical protein